jgi:DnaK suppressor protein
MHMHYLTIEQRESLRVRLKERISALRREIAAALRRDGSENALRFANHLDETDDEAVADLESSIEIAEVQRDVQELRELESAEKRLHEPEYGVCADCGADIPYARLSSNPAATRCVACQRLAERRQAGQTGPSL